jgi:hypothetical protein
MVAAGEAGAEGQPPGCGPPVTGAGEAGAGAQPPGCCPGSDDQPPGGGTEFGAQVGGRGGGMADSGDQAAGAGGTGPPLWYTAARPGADPKGEPVPVTGETAYGAVDTGPTGPGAADCGPGRVGQAT